MISSAERNEIDEIVALTKACGKNLRENGIDQWDENYPDRESIENDIATQTLFAYKEGSEIIGIVVLNESQDEEYKQMIGPNKSTSDLASECQSYLDAGPPEHMTSYVPESLTEIIIAHGAQSKTLDPELRESVAAYLGQPSHVSC